jgi:CheY-like chemotaxis protein
LGLTISQRLVEAMGGKIEIDSTEGHGSTFFFTVAVKEGDEARIEEAATGRGIPKKSDKALKILVVEDNEINQKLIKEFLSRMGHELEQAMSGEDGLKMMERENYDVVLMDIELPGISGMGATKAIRAMTNRDKASTPVIALSGNVSDEDIRACYAANMNGHLAKPIEPEKLTAALDKVASGNLDNPVELAEQAEENTGIRQVNLYSDELEEKSAVELAAKGNGPGLDEPAILDEVQKEKEPPVFDESFLKNLRGSMDMGDFKELLDDLFNKADEIIDVLVANNKSGNITEVAEKAHELKGMAGNFGLTAMSKIAEDVEEIAKANKREGLAELLATLPEIHNQSKTALQEWMGREA